MGSFSTRFGLVFYSDTTNAERGLDRMSSHLDSLRTTLVSMKDSAGEVFHALLGGFEALGEKILHTATEFQAARTQFEFVFGEEKAGGYFDTLKKTALGTSQTLLELHEIVTNLMSQGHINVFGDDIVKMAASGQLKAKLGDPIRDAGAGVRVLADIASRVGIEPMQRFMINFVAAGNTSARVMRQIHASHKATDEMKKAVAGVTDEQERFRKVLPILAREFGGLSAFMQQKSIAFLIPQLKDIQEQMSLALGEPMLNRLRGPLGEFVDIFSNPSIGFLVHPERMQGIVSVFSYFGSVLERVAHEAVSLFKSMFEFVNLHPGVLKLAATLALIATGVAGLIASLISIQVAVFAIGAAFGGWMTPLLVIGAAITVAAYKTAEMLLKAKGLKDTWDAFKLVVGGVAEIFATMTLGHAQLSKQTADALQERGLMGLVTTIGMIAYRVTRVWDGLVLGIKNAWPQVQHAFEPVMDRLHKWFESTGMAAKTSSDKWLTAGFTIGQSIAKALEILAKVLDRVMGAMEWVISHKAALVEVFAGFTAFKFGMGLAEKVGSFKEHLGIGPQKGIPVFVTNWPGGGSGGGGGGSFAGTAAKGFLSVIGLSAGEFVALAAPLAAAVAGLVWVSNEREKLVQQLEQHDKEYNARYQNDPDFRRAEDDKLMTGSGYNYGGYKGGIHRTHGGMQTFGDNSGHLVRKPNGDLVFVVNVDGSKAVEKRVKTDADRTGAGDVVP